MSESLSSVPDDAGVVDLVDVEECGKSGHKPPKARRYRIRVDTQRYVVEVSSMTGRRVTGACGKDAPGTVHRFAKAPRRANRDDRTGRRCGFHDARHRTVYDSPA